MLLTAPGAAAIAVVRIAGPLVTRFLAQHFSKPVHESRCVHAELLDGEHLIDDPVVVLLPDDRGADINVHGGPWVVRSLLNLLERFGFEIGPADLEAMDGANLLEREVMHSLSLATTELALRTLLAQPDAWQRATPDMIPSILADRALWWLLHPPRVAIVGAPNVGKSTLANQLFAHERSITADLPGTTRDWVGELANLDGLTVMLLDTPGIRATDDAIERASITRSAGQVRSTDLVIVVLDPTRPPDEQLRLVTEHPDALVVANKCDRPPSWDAAARADVSTVATTGEGIDALRRAIRIRFGCDGIDATRPRWWTARQRASLERGELPFTASGECPDTSRR